MQHTPHFSFSPAHLRPAGNSPQALLGPAVQHPSEAELPQITSLGCRKAPPNGWICTARYEQALMNTE